VNHAPRSSDDGRERIASALAVSPKCVKLDRCVPSPSGWNLRCWGNFAGTRFFAKIFRADPYPLNLPVSIPGAENPGCSSRPVEEEIDTEWKMTNELRALAGPEFVPAVLGESKAAKTIVWEEGPGVRMRDWIGRARWRDPEGKAGAPALFHAGRCLRNIHERSFRTCETLDLAQSLEIVSRLESQNGASQYLGLARQVLREAQERIEPGGKLTIPVAFSHGDLALANLIWSREHQRLSVVGFERCAYRNICHDLLTIIFSLRGHLINPIVPKEVIFSWEEEFWAGYGPVSKEIFVVVSALALSRVFYDSLEHLATRRSQRGWMAGASTRVYKTLFESFVLSQRLGFIPHDAAERLMNGKSFGSLE
jgi:hypothetical protein